MSMIILLAIIVTLIVAVGIVIGPMLAWKFLPERAVLNGVSVIKDGIVCASLLPLGPHEAALIDAGNDVEGNAILAELSRQGLTPEDIKFILLTHGHRDHIGAVHKFPGAQLMAMEAEVDVVEGRSNGGAPILVVRPPRPTGIKLSRLLHDGEEFDLGSHHVRVLAVPGHTPGSAAFAIDQNLFMGDSANHGRDGRLKGAPWVVNYSSAQNKQSLISLARRLAGDTSIKALIFGHSAPMERGVEALEEYARDT
jgi:hydroxyacylglutathione hydrolase